MASTCDFHEKSEFKLIPSNFTKLTRSIWAVGKWRGGICLLTTRQTTLTSLSRRQPITINYWITWHRPRRMQEANNKDSRALRAEYCIVGIPHNGHSKCANCVSCCSCYTHISVAGWHKVNVGSTGGRIADFFNFSLMGTAENTEGFELYG